MAGNEIEARFVGNLTADPEIKRIANNTAVLNVRIASTPRVFDRDAGEYKDGETTFIKLTMWRDLAENAANSLSQGNRIMGWGVLKQDEWVDEEDVKHTVHYIEVAEVGPSLQWATATPERSTSKGGGKSKPAAAAPADKAPAKEKPKAKPAPADDEDDEF